MNIDELLLKLGLPKMNANENLRGSMTDGLQSRLQVVSEISLMSDRDWICFAVITRSHDTPDCFIRSHPR
jgi:hypothetical protein